MKNSKKLSKNNVLPVTIHREDAFIFLGMVDFMIEAKIRQEKLKEPDWTIYHEYIMRFINKNDLLSMKMIRKDLVPAIRESLKKSGSYNKSYKDLLKFKMDKIEI